jgi:hypothetical protein
MALPPPAARQAKAPYSTSCRNVTKCYKEPRDSGPSTKARISVEAKPKKTERTQSDHLFSINPRSVGQASTPAECLQTRPSQRRTELRRPSELLPPACHALSG